MRKTAYVGVGSNLGDKIGNCLSAMDAVAGISGCELTGRSDLFKTEPVGVEGQDWYVNGVVAVSTALSARDLLGRLLGIEASMGRERKKKWDARIIDLDLLLYGDEVLHEPSLTVPHPLMHLRKFVLVPMVQVSPETIHPLLGKSMADLLANLPESGQAVVPMEGR